MKKIVVRVLIIGAVAAAAWGGYTAYKQIPQKQQTGLPTAKVRQGDVVVRSYSRGELRAVRSVSLTAPNLFGTVQVTKLASLGAFAKEKDLVAEFDDSELLSQIEEKQLELDQLDEQIKKSEADLKIRGNQDQVELLTTQYSVRRAELEVKRNELISAIDAKRNELSLEEARRRLKQLESDIQSRREQAKAELAVLQERKNKSLLEMQRWRQRLAQVKLLAPMTGLVAIKQNRGSGFFFAGMSLPDIREGDQLQPGMPVVDVLDLSELEVIARVGELDRANLTEGQDVVMTLDAIAGKTLHGKIKAMSGTASANVFANDPAKKFDVIFSVDMKELLTALGASQEQINKVLATAEANRKKGPLASPAAGLFAGGMPGGGAMMIAGGGAGGAMMMGGAPGGQGGGGGPQMLRFQGPGGQGGPGGGGFGGGAQNMSPEQQQQMRDIMQKALGGKNPMELSDDERQKAFQKMREEMQKAGINASARGERKGGERKGGEGKGGEGKGGERKGRERKGGEAGGPGGMPAFAGAAQQFSQRDLDNAKLPPPPEEDSQLEVLLRPGLLADVEIIIEKIPNAIYIPAQAVFQRNTDTVVYVKQAQRFVPRVVKPLKRTESTMVISEGLKPGEEIALQDPEEKPGAKKKGAEKGDSGGGGGAPMMPTGKKG